MALRIEFDGTNGPGIRPDEVGLFERVAAKLRDCSYGSDHEALTAEGAFYRATEAVAKAITDAVRESKVRPSDESGVEQAK